MRCAVWLALLVAAGCGRRARPARDAAPGPSTHTAAAPVTSSAPPTPHPFVTGQVVIAAEKGGRVVPLRLDPATGAWLPLGGDEHDNLFPTEVSDGDAVLAIATRGEHEGEHVEQLAWVRGATVERVGPRAPMVRNPGRAGAALIYESNAASFRDLYRLDGAAVARLTDDAAGNLEPAVSPDGATVAFVSSRDGDAELYRMPTAGGRATRLTASARDDWGVRWSPDGRRLAFVSDREGAPRVFVMDADGTDLARLTDEHDPDATEDAPRWSPDGRAVVFVRGAARRTELRLREVGGRASRSLTPADASDTEAAWSPDGAYLVVARRPAGAAAARVVFVRTADGVAVAADAPAPLTVRWYPRSSGGSRG